MYNSEEGGSLNDGYNFLLMRNEKYKSTFRNIFKVFCNVYSLVCQKKTTSD